MSAATVTPLAAAPSATRFVYALDDGPDPRHGIDCPLSSGHAARIDRHGDRLSIHCLAGCDHDDVKRTFAPLRDQVLAELKGLDAVGPAPRRASGGRASLVVPRAVDWLWFPYLPLGKLSALAGQMGQAKSLATCWLHAAVTNGTGINLGRSANTVMWNAEDDAADTIRPRLEAAGADLERIWIETDIMLTADRLASICDEMGDVALVTVDPVQAYMPAGVNSWKGQDVRSFFEPFRHLAMERGLSIVLVQHLNRRADAGDALARIADSQGIPQLARSVLIWGPDPSDPEGDQGSSKALTRAKGNLARSSDSATFTIEERTVSQGIKAPTLVRGDDKTISADEVVSDVETRTAGDEAVDWLRLTLADGPVDAKEILVAAREVGISERTLKRAKRPAGVVSEQSRSESGITGWHWLLKDVGTPPKEDGILGTLGTLGPLRQDAKEAKKANDAKVAKRSEDAAEGFCGCRVPAPSPRGSGPPRCATCRRETREGSA